MARETLSIMARRVARGRPPIPCDMKREMTEQTSEPSGAAKRALIVGNSDGIGLAFTERLLAEGWQVQGISRSPSRLQHPAYGHTVADAGAPDFGQVVARVLADHGPFELVTYAAGMGSDATLEDLGPDTRVMAVNLMGALRTSEQVVPAFVRARRGHLIVLSSLADELVVRGAEAYAASKAAMSTYFLALGLKLRRVGVAITVVRFGFVNTKMARASVKPFMRSTAWAVNVLMRTLRRRPRRVSAPWTMAALVRLLRWLLAWRAWGRMR